MRQRLVSITILALAALAPRAGQAKPLDYAVSPEELPASRRPISMFAGEYVPDSFGPFTTGVTVNVPPARNGHQPEVRLGYGSSGGVTSMGVGWSLFIPHVRRSLRHGTPRYSGPKGSPYQPPGGAPFFLEDAFEYVLGDASGELSYVGKHVDPGYLVYKPSPVRSFAVFYYKPADDTWIVQDGDGVTYYLGESGARETSDCAPPCKPTFAWYARRVVDSFGNLIRYTYTTAGGLLYPTQIGYDLRVDATVQNYPRVIFTWTTNTVPRAVSCSRGYRTVLDGNLLTRVDVYGVNETGAALSRRYTVENKPLTNGRHVSIFRVTPEGLPSSTFVYNPEHAALSATAAVTNPRSSGAGTLETIEERGLEVVRTPTAMNLFTRFSSPVDPYYICLNPEMGQQQATTARLVDIDGDGDLDQLVLIDSMYYQGSPAMSRYWRRNVGGQLEQTALPVSISGGPGGCSGLTTAEICVSGALTYSYLAQNAILVWQTYVDIDGDGKVDFLHYDPTGHIWACLGDGTGQFGVSIVGCTRWTPSGAVGLAKCGTVAACSMPANCPGTQEHYALGHSGQYGDITQDIAGLLDVNGDGLLDYVRPHRVAPDDDRLFVHLNTGAGFEASKYPLLATKIQESGGGIREYTTGSDSPLMYDLRDVNGDGVPDRLATIGGEVDTGFSVLLGKGPRPGGSAGFFDTTASGFSLTQAVTIGHSTSLEAPPGTSDTIRPKHEHEGLYDVTGDGILDFVRYDDSTKQHTFHAGNGQGYETSAALPVGAGLFEGIVHRRHGVGMFACSACNDPFDTTVTTQLLIDFNGDGVLELLRGATDPFSTTSSRSWMTSGAAASPAPPLLIKEVTSGPAKDTVTYGRPKALPSVAAHAPWVVKKIVQADRGAPGLTPSRVKELEYAGPVFDAARRQFLGHSLVTLKEGGGMRTTVTSYWTGENNHGLRKESSVHDGSTTLKHEQDTWEAFVFDQSTPGGARYWMRPTATTTTVIDQEDTVKTQIAYGYFSSELNENAFGLTRSITQRGYLTSSGANEDP